MSGDYDTITTTIRVKHGTVSGYIRGCRCDPCKEANSAYYKEWRAAHRDRISAYNRVYYLRNKQARRALRDVNGRIIRWVDEVPA